MESGDCCWLIKGNGDDGTTSKPCQAHSERGGEATLEPFFAICFCHPRLPSTIATCPWNRFAVPLPCHVAAMQRSCRIDIAQSHPDVPFLVRAAIQVRLRLFFAHSELYRKRLFRKANLARQSRAGTWRSNLSQRRVVGVMRK